MNNINESIRNRLLRILHEKTDIEKAVVSAAERLYCEPEFFGYSCKTCPLGGSIVGGEYCDAVAAVQLYQYLLQGVSPFDGFCSECEVPLSPDEYEVKHKSHIKSVYDGVNIVIEDLFVCTCKECGGIVDVPFYAKLNQINFDLGYAAALQEE